MITIDELKAKLGGMKTAVDDLRDALSIEASEKRLAELEHQMTMPGFYDDQARSQKVISEMGVEITPLIANCLYTGLVTDTGCFRHSSTTVDSHRAAEKLLQAGADMRMIHRLAFESVSRGKVALLVEAMQQIRYELDGRCAILVLPRDRINALGVADDELEGIAALPRQIEGVQVGVTLRQYKSYRGYKVSVRTDGIIDASAICARLNGGGHRGAAGCNVEELPLEEVYRRVLRSVEQELAGN